MLLAQSQRCYCTRAPQAPLFARATVAQGVAAVGSADRPESGRCDRRRVAQMALLAVIATFLISTALGVRGSGGHPRLGDILQNLSYLAAATLCLLRTPKASAARNAWRCVALGLLLFGLSNVNHVLWTIAYVLIFIALVLLVRSRVSRLPLTRWLDGLVVGLGAATVAALLAATIWGEAAQPVIALVAPAADLFLLTLVVAAAALFRSPPPSLLFVTAGLLILGFADFARSTRTVWESDGLGGMVDVARVLAVTALALAPGWGERARTTLVPATLSARAVAPLTAATAVISVLVAASYGLVSPVAGYLAVATLLAALGRQAVAFCETRQAGEQAHLAHTDELTGLLNRRGFYGQAAPVLSSMHTSGAETRTCALLLLDLNHFKDFNDSLGHAAGDELLRRVAARLRASLRKGDILARLGGDEFALILPDVGVDEAVQAAVALNTALEQTVTLDGLHVQTGASIGIALGPNHGRDLGTLLGHADAAMYRAKQGQAGYLVYTPDAEQRGSTRYGMELLAQLRHAIKHGELALHYQPKLCMATGEIVGVEALVRWHHPERGLLYPDQFLPLARHNALMYAMNELVVQRALDDAAVWHAHGHRIPVAINLFPPTLADLDLPDRLEEALRRKGLTPAALAVEITEEFLLANLDRGRTVLDGLHRRGITIAIDDFGKGNSSLNHFRHLPIDEVKLDRSLSASITEDPCAAAIVRSVIGLSRTLGLTTVAEGVESPATAAVLTGYGCDIAQGHLYCQPLTAAQTLDLLAQRRNAVIRSEPAQLADCQQAGEPVSGNRSATARIAVAVTMLAGYAGNVGTIARHLPLVRPVLAPHRPARPRHRGTAR